MSFGLAIFIFILLIIGGVLGFKLLSDNEPTPSSKISTLEDLLEREKKKNNYKAPIFFFSTFIALLFMSWVFDSGYERLGEKKLYKKVVEEIDTILTFSIPPPPPPPKQPEPEPQPEKIEVEVPDIVIVEEEEKKDTVVIKTPDIPVPAPPSQGPPGPPQQVDTKAYFPSELTSPAEYPGGHVAETAYLQKKFYNIKAPAKNRAMGQAYTMKISVVIEKDGRITDAKLDKRSQALLDQATQDRIIQILESMPNWIPGKVLDEPKRSRYFIPITLAP